MVLNKVRELGGNYRNLGNLKVKEFQFRLIRCNRGLKLNSDDDCHLRHILQGQVFSPAVKILMSHFGVPGFDSHLWFLAPAST